MESSEQRAARCPTRVERAPVGQVLRVEVSQRAERLAPLVMVLRRGRVHVEQAQRRAERVAALPASAPRAAVVFAEPDWGRPLPAASQE